MLNIEKKFDLDIDEAAVRTALMHVGAAAKANRDNPIALRRCLASIDLTTLNPSDGPTRGMQFAHRVNAVPEHFGPDMPNVAAICVYPSLVPSVREHLKAPGVQLAAVAACFPASQTFIEVKLEECRRTLEAGADELDVVISCGEFLEGNYFTVYDELRQIKAVCGEHHLKVILETGLIPSLRDVKLASFLAMEAGADFIKTSTGKLNPAATPEAVYAMCQSIKEFEQHTGRRVGIKPAGGLADTDDALLYYCLVEHVLGEQWLNPNLFRLGASRMANNLVSDIVGSEVKYF